MVDFALFFSGYLFFPCVTYLCFIPNPPFDTFPLADHSPNVPAPLFFLLFDFGRAGTVAVPADLLLVLAVDDVVVVFLVVFVLVLVFLHRVLVLLVIKGLADGLCPNVALL